MTTESIENGSKSPGGRPQCFVIMPISDQPGYNPDHFADVYQYLIRPAVEAAGYSPLRGDDVKHANIIHIDILQRILDAPMALCDLSSVNGNVMFELGLRQAFQKPVVLIKDDITREIFDVGPIRTVKYKPDWHPRNLEGAKANITAAIQATRDARPDEGGNSILSLLSLEAATLRDVRNSPENARMLLLEQHIIGIREDIQRLIAAVGRQSDADQLNQAIEAQSKTIIRGNKAYMKNLSVSSLERIINSKNTNSDVLQVALTEFAKRGEEKSR